MTPNHPVVSHEQWLAARKELLAKEKEFTRLREELSQTRRELPWEAVNEDYTFTGPHGTVKLSDLFEGKTQLIVFHFMFAPNWDAGCPSCSFWADNFNGVDVHLKHRDITFVAISRAPYEKLAAYRNRMGWTFPWVSSHGTGFNYDYFVSFTPEEIANGAALVNYEETAPFTGDLPGFSVFVKDEHGKLFHTYSTYARGLDILNGAYQAIDLTPKGRDEAGQRNPQFWVRRHDEYPD